MTQRSIGAVQLTGTTDSNGNNAGNVTAEITSPLAESWSLKDGSTLAASGVAIVNGTSLFLPYDRLRITEDGGANPVTWVLQMNTRESVLRISTAGTIKIEGEINGVFWTIKAEDYIKVSKAATGLAAGTWWIG